MAKVTQVKLAPIEYSGDQATVKVEYDIEFTPDEIGQSWRLAVEICGYDGGKKLATPPLYKFKYGGGFFKLPYTTVVPSGPVLSQTVSRTLERDTVDEDPGFDLHDAGGVQVPVPRQDELFARVTISRQDVEVSPTVTTSA